LSKERKTGASQTLQACCAPLQAGFVLIATPARHGGSD
jgi:hypothetical protein